MERARQHRTSLMKARLTLTAHSAPSLSRARVRIATVFLSPVKWKKERERGREVCLHQTERKIVIFDDVHLFVAERHRLRRFDIRRHNIIFGATSRHPTFNHFPRFGLYRNFYVNETDLFQDLRNVVRLGGARDSASQSLCRFEVFG